MTTTAGRISVSTRSTTAAGAALVVLAVGQLVSSTLSGLADSPLMQAGRPDEPPITPLGYTFAIWGVIEVLSVALAIWLFFFRRRASDAAVPVVDGLTRALLIVFAGFSLWLAASIIEPVWATLAVFLVMAVGLVAALRVAVTNRAEIAGWSRPGWFLTWTTLGLYAGWSTVAIWLNLLTALGFSGVPITGTVGVVGQLAILAGATATAVLVLRKTSGLIPYALAVVWALVGAILGAADAGEALLAEAAGVGLLIVAIVAVRLRTRRAPRPAST